MKQRNIYNENTTKLQETRNIKQSPVPTVGEGVSGGGEGVNIRPISYLHYSKKYIFVV